MNLRYIFSFLLFFYISLVPLFAQSSMVIVKNTDSEPIPFLYAICHTSGKYTISNHNGVLILDRSLFNPTDTLTFVSLFYEPVKIRFDSLIKKREIIIPFSSSKLEAVTITALSESSRIEIVKKVAADFDKNHATDYIARMTRLHTIKCNEEYREFHGLYGIIGSFDFTQQKPDTDIWFMDSNQPLILPLSVMKSYSITSDGNDILHDISSDAALASGHIKTELLNAGYFVRRTEPTALRAKRGIEIFSPLNTQQVANYRYSIEQIETEDNGTVFKIHFTTKPSSFPRKTRLYGEGIIYARAADYRVIKVEVENIHDYYTSHPRRMMREPYSSATRHSLTILYETSRERIVDSKVILNMEWISPGKGDNYHSIKQPSRPNPIENRLTEYEYYVFDDFRLIQQRDIKTSYFLEYLKMGIQLYDSAPFDRDLWDKIEMPGIDRTRLNNDLSGIGISLYQQAERNAFYIDLTSKRLAKDDEERALSILERTKQLEQQFRSETSILR